jgi:hypothetical protein
MDISVSISGAFCGRVPTASLHVLDLKASASFEAYGKVEMDIRQVYLTF